MNTTEIVNKLCDADAAKTNFVVRRVRALVNIGMLTRAFNKSVKKQLAKKQLSLF